MKAMITVMAVGCCAATALAALTSRSYVQDGLIAQYDGINNVGHDLAHDPNAATWVDLTGNGNNGTVNTAVTWGEKGWVNSTTNIQPVTVGTGLAAAIASAGKFSAQMTFTPSDNNRLYLFAQKSGTSKEFGIGRVNEDGNNAHNQIELYAVRPYWKRVYSGIRVFSGDWSAITF